MVILFNHEIASNSGQVTRTKAQAPTVHCGRDDVTQLAGWTRRLNAVPCLTNCRNVRLVRVTGHAESRFNGSGVRYSRKVTRALEIRDIPRWSSWNRLCSAPPLEYPRLSGSGSSCAACAVAWFGASLGLPWKFIRTRETPRLRACRTFHLVLVFFVFVVRFNPWRNESACAGSPWHALYEARCKKTGGHPPRPCLLRFCAPRVWVDGLVRAADFFEGAFDLFHVEPASPSAFCDMSLLLPPPPLLHLH